MYLCACSFICNPIASKLTIIIAKPVIKLKSNPCHVRSAASAVQSITSAYTVRMYTGPMMCNTTLHKIAYGMLYKSA